MKKTILNIAVVCGMALSAAFAVATPASAEVLTTYQSDNYVKSASMRVPGTNTWAPGLLVKADGVESFHFVGDGGVTKAMVFTDYEAATLWAEQLTGMNIRPVGKQSTSRGFSTEEVRDPKGQLIEVATVSGRWGHDLVWR